MRKNPIVIPITEGDVVEWNDLLMRVIEGKRYRGEKVIVIKGPIGIPIRDQQRVEVSIKEIKLVSGRPQKRKLFPWQISYNPKRNPGATWHENRANKLRKERSRYMFMGPQYSEQWNLLNERVLENEVAIGESKYLGIKNPRPILPTREIVKKGLMKQSKSYLWDGIEELYGPFYKRDSRVTKKELVKWTLDAFDTPHGLLYRR